MATTDLHMQVLPYDYRNLRETHDHGFARTATLIHTARRESVNSLLLDNGDFMCGTDMQTATARAPHPMIAIMNHLGYDAATPGNHDFDHGLEHLERVAGQARFPFVSANALRHRGAVPGDDRGLFAPFAILERRMIDADGQPQDLRIGVTGFLPPHSLPRHPDDPFEVQTRDIVEAARAVVPRMRAAGADVIIALAHSGIGCCSLGHDTENAVIPLARIDGIDAIVAGHGHQVFPGPDWPKCATIDPARGTILGKPVVSAGFWGSHLGVIDLELERGESGWHVRRHQAQARPIFRRGADGVQPRAATDPEVRRIITPVHRRMLDWARRPVGQLREPVHSFFTLAAPSRAVQLVQRAQIWHVRHALDLPEDAPLLSSACAFRGGGFGGPGNFTDLAPGPLAQAAIADLYPFPNEIAVISVDGRALRDWLERAAAVFNRAQAQGTAQMLKPRDLPAYLYEAVLGVEYEIDLSQPARFDRAGRRIDPTARRIRNLRHRGRPVPDDARFLMVTNNYRLGGGGRYPVPLGCRPLDLPRAAISDVLRAFFAAHDEVSVPLDPHWRFAPAPGAALRFRSSPKALAHLDEVSTNRIVPAGIDEGGYQLFELIL